MKQTLISVINYGMACVLLALFMYAIVNNLTLQDSVTARCMEEMPHHHGAAYFSTCVSKD